MKCRLESDGMSFSVDIHWCSCIVGQVSVRDLLAVSLSDAIRETLQAQLLLSERGGVVSRL